MFLFLIRNDSSQKPEIKLGLKPSYCVTEIGCGIGRFAIPLSQILSRGSYLGVGYNPFSVEWRQQHTSTSHPNFRFVHCDVKDDLHNPSGTIRTVDIRLPLASRFVDRIVLWSVLTYLYRDEIEHYFREVRGRFASQR